MFARTKGRGGLIVIDTAGNIGHFASTERMAWASAEGSEGCDAQKIDSGIDNQDVCASIA